jgi:hypothetical protein
LASSGASAIHHGAHAYHGHGHHHYVTSLSLAPGFATPSINDAIILTNRVTASLVALILISLAPNDDISNMCINAAVPSPEPCTTKEQWRERYAPLASSFVPWNSPTVYLPHIYLSIYLSVPSISLS